MRVDARGASCFSSRRATAGFGPGTVKCDKIIRKIIPKSSDLRCVFLKSPDRNKPFPAISKHDTGLMMPHLKSKRSLVLNNGNRPHITFVSSWCGSSTRTRTRRDFPRFVSKAKCNGRLPIRSSILLWFFWVHVDTFRLISGLLTMILVWDVGSAHLKIGPNDQRSFRNTPIFEQDPDRNKPFPALSKHFLGLIRPLSKSQDIPMSSSRDRVLVSNRWVFDPAPCIYL